MTAQAAFLWLSKFFGTSTFSPLPHSRLAKAAARARERAGFVQNLACRKRPRNMQHFMP